MKQCTKCKADMFDGCESCGVCGSDELKIISVTDLKVVRPSKDKDGEVTDWSQDVAEYKNRTKSFRCNNCQKHIIAEVNQYGNCVECGEYRVDMKAHLMMNHVEGVEVDLR